MDALEILKEMHGEAKAAFGKIEHADVGERGGLWAHLHPELLLHEQLEERFVYDPMAEDLGKSDPKLGNWHHRHHEEVGEAEHIMDEIGRAKPEDAHWLELVEKLHAALENHIHTEEHEIWPMIRDKWGSEKLEQAAGPMQAAKNSGMAESGEATRSAREEHAA